MRKPIKLLAGKPENVGVTGRILYILDTGVAPSVDIEATFDGVRTEDYGACANRYRITANDGERITSLLLKSAVDTTLELSMSDRDFDIQDGAGGAVAAVVLDPASLPLAVTSPAPGLLVHESNTQTASYHNPVAVTAVATQVIAAGAYKRVTIVNNGANPVGISRGVTTFAKCAIVLAVGDSYIEERFADNGQDFHAICGAALTATVTVETYA